MKMAHSISTGPFSDNRKGMYAIITTIFFVFILIFGAIAYVGISRMMGKVQAEADDQLMKYNHIQIVKDRIMSMACYTQNLEEITLNNTCNISSDMVIGYRFVMHKFRNCTNTSKQWDHGDVDHFKKSFKYMVAIRSNETGFMCPGELFLYY
jgi:hypothetical protein